MTQPYTILFTLIYKGENYPVQTYYNQYYSLMVLISGTLAIPGFGLCCGMGSCGTCLVQIRHNGSAIKKSVLACDVRVDDALANTDIIVPDNGY